MKLNLWTLGFIFLIVGIGIPISYGIYEIMLSQMEWYWSVSITLIVFGIILLLVSAIKERMKESKPKEKV